MIPDPAELPPDGESIAIVVARVVNENGMPMSGVCVSFGVDPPEYGSTPEPYTWGSVDPPSIATNADGEATATYTAGTTDGDPQVWAAITSSPMCSSAQIRKSSGAGQNSVKKRKVILINPGIYASMDCAEIKRRLGWVKSFWTLLGFVKSVEYLDHYLDGSGTDKRPGEEFLLAGGPVLSQSGTIFPKAGDLFNTKCAEIMSGYPHALSERLASIDYQLVALEKGSGLVLQFENLSYGVTYLGLSDQHFAVGAHTVALSSQVNITRTGDTSFTCECTIRARVDNIYDWDVGSGKEDFTFKLGKSRLYTVERAAMEKLKQKDCGGAREFSMKEYFIRPAGSYIATRNYNGTYTVTP